MHSNYAVDGLAGEADKFGRPRQRRNAERHLAYAIWGRTRARTLRLRLCGADVECWCGPQRRRSMGGMAWNRMHAHGHSHSSHLECGSPPHCTAQKARQRPDEAHQIVRDEWLRRRLGVRRRCADRFHQIGEGRRRCRPGSLHGCEYITRAQLHAHACKHRQRRQHTACIQSQATTDVQGGMWRLVTRAAVRAWMA